MTKIQHTGFKSKSEPEKIAIAVCTFCRPATLAPCLAAIARLEAPPGLALQVLVIDNDAQGSARAVVDQQRSHMPWPLHYTVHAGGAVAAHNKALAMATQQDAQALAFCDDDGEVAPQWIKVLHSTRKRYQADVVTDYIRVRFEHPLPGWMCGDYISLVYLRRPAHTAPLPATHARSGNVLFDLRLHTKGALSFSPRYEILGYDTHFFMRAAKQGARIYALNEKLIIETWPPARAGLRWLLWRQYTIGYTTTRIEKEVHGFYGLCRSLLTGSFKLCIACICPLASMIDRLRGRPSSFRLGLARGCVYAARGIGHWAGLKSAFFSKRKERSFLP